MVTLKKFNDYITDIQTTDIDTFALKIRIRSSEQTASNISNYILQFQIAKESWEDPIISKRFNSVDGYFSVFLTSEEKGRLPQGNYVYRLTLIDDNNIITTTKDGRFTVKWGA